MHTVKSLTEPQAVVWGGCNTNTSLSFQQFFAMCSVLFLLSAINKMPSLVYVSVITGLIIISQMRSIDF